MVIPVVWYQAFDDERHEFWDQTIVRALLDREAWRPVDALDYRHVEGFDEVEGDGAVVVVPARQHADDERVAALIEALERLEWALVILTGDEGAEFPWERLRGPRRRVWVQTPRPDRHEAADGLLPNGYGPGTREAVAGCGEPVERRWSWSFAGQVTHERREQLVEALAGRDDGLLRETRGFTEGYDRAAYTEVLVESRLAFAPTGPVHPDTFRLYEALEAGAVPIVERGYVEFDFWRFIYGEVPFPVVGDWAGIVEALDGFLDRWAGTAARCSAWWQAEKRRLAYRLDDQVRDIAAITTHGDDLGDLVTAVITTSPVAAHPSTDVLEETVASIRERVGPDVEIIIAADGVRREQRGLSDRYDDYLRRVTRLAAHEWTNVMVSIEDRFVHQANVTRRVLDEVKTPLLLFVEHDTPLVGPIEWAPLVDLVRSGEANVVRFYHEAAIHPEHERLMVDPSPIARPRSGAGPEEVALVRRTMQWSQRPHLASLRFYRSLLDRYFAERSRTMIEDVLHGIVEGA